MPDVGENIPIRIYDTTKQWVLATESYLGKVKDRYQEIYPASIVTRSGPRTIGHEYHWKFRQQLYVKLAPAFVALIPNGRIWGPQGTVMTEVFLQMWLQPSIEAPKNTQSSPSKIYPPLLNLTVLQ